MWPREPTVWVSDCVSLLFKDCPRGAELIRHVAMLPKVIRFAPDYYAEERKLLLS